MNAPKTYSKWINIKREFERIYGASKSGGITQMCAALNIKMKGRLHSGIDDCENIAQIILHMRNGALARPITPGMFPFVE